jgi:ABC-type transport system substrate-binding protein
MRRFGWQWFAVSSLLLSALAASAETRPQYGGTLHVSLRAAVTSLDPADRTVADSVGRRSITGLIFETLVTVDDTGSVKPALAESWQLSPDNQRCQFRVRHNVKFHDGMPLTPEIAAASLRFGNPSWNVIVSGDTVVVDDGNSDREILAQLALSRNAIVRRDGEHPDGTGPFRIVNWEAGKRLVLAADDSNWRGRPFLDGIEIELGKNFREQSMAWQLGRLELVEIAPENAQHTPQGGRRIANSAPMEVVALVFTRDAASADEKNQRDALRLSIERGSIYDVLLKRAGEPSGSILPTWISGYGFVFSAVADLAKARQLRGLVRVPPNWKLGYDANDPLDRLLADRIALNARDAGLSIQPLASSAADLRLVRIALASPDSWTALADFLNQCGISQVPEKGNSIEDIYEAEQAILAPGRVIPLFHLPVSYASSSTLKNWSIRVDGSWDVSDAWLDTTKP